MLPILYSFRRCPYAMRARWALHAAKIQVDRREVSLRAKPEGLLQASPKGTVPVLVLPAGRVIEESLDIMLWALAQNDPEAWLSPEQGTLDDMLSWIQRCEQELKPHLDRYKYPSRYRDEWLGQGQENSAGPQETMFSDAHFQHALKFLGALTERLDAMSNQEPGCLPGLWGCRPALADFAIVPFVRQMARHDRPRFEGAVAPRLLHWMDTLLGREDFERVMEKPA